MRGKRPTPSHLKLLTGTQRKDRANPAEPQYDKPKLLRPPSWLSADAKRTFKTLGKQLTESGVMKSCDTLALSLLAEAHATYCEADRLVREEGLTYTANSGLKKITPAVRIRLDAANQVRHLMTEFGLTPSSRSRVKGDPTLVNDPLQEFIARKSAKAWDEI